MGTLRDKMRRLKNHKRGSNNIIADGIKMDLKDKKYN